MQIFEPIDCLRPFIKAFMVVESNDLIVNRLLPDTSVTVAIRLGGHVQFKEQAGNTCLPKWSLSGLRKSFRLVEYGKNSANILVQFKAGGTTAFFDLPIHEIFESNVDLDNFFKQSELTVLDEQLQETVTIREKVDVVQQFFIATIHYHTEDLLIANSVEKIKAVNGQLNVKGLSDSLNISLDSFEKRFRRYVGATPKEFADIVRMRTIIGQGQIPDNLLLSALDAGFFDQSHFTRNFKRFTGLTPKKFFHALGPN